MPELGLELVRRVDRDRIRSRLPRWDSRAWGDAAFLKNTRPGKRLLKLGLAWGRERVKARKLQQENATPQGEVAPVSRFTGKEEDLEAGVIYFGKRYLSAFTGRWMSADPLAVHAPGSADLNLYAYVNGQVLKNTDPLGLTGPPPGVPNPEGGEGAGPGPSPAPAPVESPAPAPATPDLGLPGATLLHPEGRPVDTPLGCFVSHGAAMKAEQQAQKVTVASPEPSGREDTIGPAHSAVPRSNVEYGFSANVLSVPNAGYLGVTGDVEGYLHLQQLGSNLTDLGFAVFHPPPQLRIVDPVAVHPTFAPGPYAAESIPARSPDQHQAMVF